MAEKLISVVGPTGTGKTSFVLKMAQSFAAAGLKFDVISADSRQVYRDLEVISGADVPPEFSPAGEPGLRGYFTAGNVRIYGVLALKYDEEWSVAHFRDFARERILEAWKNGRTPVIVGGTGLYHEHLFNPSPILNIKPDPNLRAELEAVDLNELQAELKKMAPQKLSNMNESDVKNPTRLIRAIEIARAADSLNIGADEGLAPLPEFAHLQIGLIDNLETLEAKIAARVVTRFHQGAKAEVEKLQALADDFGQNKQLLSATGVKEVAAYLAGEAQEAEVLAKWSRREFQYAKRQLTWWKKRPNIEWFKVSEPGWESAALALMQKLLY